MGTATAILVCITIFLLIGPVTEDIRDKAKERSTPFRAKVVQVCEQILRIYGLLFLLLLGLPVVLLLLGTVAVVAYTFYRGVTSLPTSAAIVVGAIIIAAAIRKRRD